MFFFWQAVCLSLPAPIHNRKDVVREKKTKTNIPPPQPASLENHPKLLLILNSFVSGTTLWRPYRWVWGFVHLRQNTNMCVRENESVWVLLLVSSALFWPCLILSALLSALASPLLLSGCLWRYISIHTDDFKLSENDVCGNQALMQCWQTSQKCYNEACAPAEMIRCDLCIYV